MSTSAMVATSKITTTTFGDEMKENEPIKKNVANCHDLRNDCKSKTTLEVKEHLNLSEPGARLSISLKDQLSLGKDDNQCPRKSSKEQDVEAAATESLTKEAESKEEPAELQVLNLTVESPGRADNVVPIPFRPSTSKETLFTLKEGSKYRIVLNFVVSKNSVYGLKYIGDVWKKGIKVDHSKKAIGSCFSPGEEAYVFELENGITPSGFFARGSYAARARFVDGDDKCFLDTTYYFDIQKNWASTTS